MRIYVVGFIAALFITGGLAPAQDIVLEEPPSKTSPGNAATAPGRSIQQTGLMESAPDVEQFKPGDLTLQPAAEQSPSLPSSAPPTVPPDPKAAPEVEFQELPAAPAPVASETQTLAEPQSVPSSSPPPGRVPEAPVQPESSTPSIAEPPPANSILGVPGRVTEMSTPPTANALLAQPVAEPTPQTLPPASKSVPPGTEMPNHVPEIPAPRSPAPVAAPPTPTSAAQPPRPVEPRSAVRPVAPATQAPPGTRSTETPAVAAAEPGIVTESVWTRNGTAQREPSFYVDAEYLLWWIRDSRMPQMVGTVPGALADVSPLSSDSLTLISNPAIVYEVQSGMRFTAGGWLNAERSIGVNASYFQLERSSTIQNYSSPGNPLLGPTYFDPSLNDQVLVANAMWDPVGGVPVSSGAMSIRTTQSLWGAEANVMTWGYSLIADRTNFLIGFRHVNFSEGINIYGLSTDLASGDTVHQFDSFGTHNRFFGPQIGFQSDYRKGPWFVNLQGKVALGVMHEIVNIQGQTTFVTAGTPTTLPGGIFAQPTNMGRHTRDEFAVVPELTVNVGYQVTSRMRAFVGYNLLFLSNVVRPGNQIDPTVDSTQVPSLSIYDPTQPATRPAFTWNETSMWIQGVNFGVEFRY